VDLVEEYTDILQVGARNVQNFALLKKVGQARKPVLLKRGMMTTLEELLMSAEYVLSSGNRQVILCERGIRTFETATRNTLDLSAVTVLKELSHLPVRIPVIQRELEIRHPLSRAARRRRRNPRGKSTPTGKGPLRRRPVAEEKFYQLMEELAFWRTP
jgi:3-deoxy-7-phosphoheptulonate synthase